MFRRVTLALALVSALTGCVAAPPKGAFVEYREGVTPTTRPVTCEATYALSSADQPSPLTAHHLMNGERIGFRREADGSVSAVAPGQVLALAPGRYTWSVVPGSVAPWRKRLGQEVSPAVPGAIFLAGVTAALGALFFWSAKSSDPDDTPEQTRSAPNAPPKQASEKGP